MSLQTPRQRSGLQRPSYGNVGSSPANNNVGVNNNTNLNASTAVARKASLQALTGQSPDPRTPAAKMGGGELEVGDLVNVPGDMYGVVKFVGNVRGKNGMFVGVELDGEFAARGKNSGDVDGVDYFNTTVPGAGIFLPVQRATKRYSPSAASDSYSPNTPTYSTVNGVRAKGTPPTPSIAAHKFSQTVGPGVRPSSPNFKPKRPSLPRPESPFRKQPPNLAPTPARTLSQSTRGSTRSGITPGKNSNFKSSTTSRQPATQTPRPYSRTGSRLGNRSESLLEEDDLTPVGSAITSNTSRTTSQGSIPSFSQPLRSPSRLGSAGGQQDQEVQRLKTQLQERDRRLEEQAASLAEMEQSVKELSALLPSDGGESPLKSSVSSVEDEGSGQTASQLRQMLREKNEKISLLTAEFDAHRADFRSTLDSLEMASTETERVYEEQKRDLIAQLEQLHDIKEQRDDFEGVALQLKGLEDLVAELEEGLEESRRGEAEARGEVEFLRGEVERGRSELKRERDKAAASGGVRNSREVEIKDDEIRGLKAIIHNLGDGSGVGGAVGVASGAGREEMEKLQTALEESQRQKEDLERELEQLRRDATTNGHGRNESERTATTSPGKPSSLSRTRSDTIKAPSRALPAHTNGFNSNNNGASGVFCEMCQSSDHDTLDCTQLASAGGGRRGHHAEPYSPGKENEHAGSSSVGGKVVENEEKWCALCEKDGHLAFDCPEEQY